MGLEERLFQARRSRCVEHLTRLGQSPDQAGRWCDAWEREAELRGWPRTGEFWDHGQLWIDAQISLRRTPDATLVRH